MACRGWEPSGSLIIDDNQSQFDFIIGQEEEIIEDLGLNGPKCDGETVGRESPAPHLLSSISLREMLWPEQDGVPK